MERRWFDRARRGSCGLDLICRERGLAFFLLADSAEATFCVGKGVIAGFETCSQAGALLRQAARSAVIIAKTLLVLSSMVVIKKVPSVLL